MPHELPIACTLNPFDFAAREQLMADLGRDALIDAGQDGTRATLRFAAGAGVLARVDSLVAGESSCCPFLSMRVREAEDAIVLTIEAPADAELVLAEMVAAFDPARRQAA